MVLAPNIEQMEATDALLIEIRDKCEEQGLPLIFALSRKRLGQVYGSRKRVSAVALLDVKDVQDLYGKAVTLMRKGMDEWERYVREGLTPPAMVMDDDDGDEEEE